MARRKLCLGCGKIINIIKHGENKKYCSNKCGIRYRRKVGLSIRSEYYKKECVICGKTFYINKSQKKLNSRFCSRACMGKGFRIEKKVNLMPRMEFICKECNIKFYDLRYKNRKFCSHNCYNKYRGRSVNK